MTVILLSLQGGIAIHRVCRFICSLVCVHVFVNIQIRLQWSTYRKWHVADRMVTSAVIVYISAVNPAAPFVNHRPSLFPVAASLPGHFVSSPSISTFWQQLKTFLFRQSFLEIIILQCCNPTMLWWTSK